MSTARSPKAGLRKSKTRAQPTSPADVTPDEGVVADAAAPPPPAPPAGGKLALMVGLLQRPDGATVAQLAEALAWQAHSVRAAMAGALKARGHVVSSEKSDAGRVYRLPAAARGEVQP